MKFFRFLLLLLQLAIILAGIFVTVFAWITSSSVDAEYCFVFFFSALYIVSFIGGRILN